MNLSDIVRRLTAPQAKTAPNDSPERVTARSALDRYIAGRWIHNQAGYNLVAPAESLEPILALNLPEQAAVYVEAWLRALQIATDRARAQFWFSDDSTYRHHRAYSQVLTRVARRKLPLTESDLAEILAAIARCQKATGKQTLAAGGVAWLPVQTLLRMLEEYVAAYGLSPSFRNHLRAVRPGPPWDLQYPLALDEKAMERIDRMCGTAPARESLDTTEPWADRALHDLASFSAPRRSVWDRLMAHAATADSARPTGRWLKEARAIVDEAGAAEVEPVLAGWLRRVPESRALMTDTNATMLRGLAWTCSMFQSPETCRALADAAQACFRKVPMEGAISMKAGNGCLYALGAMPGMEPVSQLARLQLRVKYVAALELIRKTLDAAAARQGVTADELAEMTVPTFGLDQRGRMEQRIGEYTAEIEITGTGDVELAWTDSRGQPLKGAPDSVKRSHAAELKALKQTKDDIARMLFAQRLRLERMLLDPREWPFTVWRERYLEHPLLNGLASRLIWRLGYGEGTCTALWMDRVPFDSGGNPLQAPDESTRVSLWHPIEAAPEQVLAWRRRIEESGITQPFKQAHREVYVLTDAERATETHSNRFAAHILRQHVFAALCRERGWRYTLMGAFDSHNTPALELRAHALTAEFWVDFSGDETTSPTGIYDTISTDQVRFTRGGAPVPLADLPPTLFSEVMRDVDLFVGVCSIGNDPAWQDTGARPGFGAYWHEASFGELTAAATTRADLLARLLPRLKIASRCTLKGRFLHVRGELRGYKIHLGSSNILMEPNDQYLCIVPGRSSAADGDVHGVILPFEGDRTLSIILSKAFLLADDTKIRDPLIVRQIHPS